VSEKTKIVALVPMRDRSERVPGKNYRPLAGKPLFHYIMNTLGNCPEVDEIVVDTDSPTIRDSLNSDFPSVQVINRPDHLIGGEVPMNSILLHDTAQVKADYYVQTHCTNPLLRPDTASRAITTFLNSMGKYDSLFTVTELHTRLYDADGRALNHNPAELLRTQDLPPIFEENSCLYIFSRKSLETNDHRIGKNPLMFTIPQDEAWDIDEEEDFQIADFLMHKRRAGLRE
jgi:CMP-N-acetylneuraminic acid synthetase